MPGKHSKRNKAFHKITEKAKERYVEVKEFHRKPKKKSKKKKSKKRK